MLGCSNGSTVGCVDTPTLHSWSVDDKSSKLTLHRQLVQANSCSVAEVAIAHTIVLIYASASGW